MRNILISPRELRNGLEKKWVQNGRGLDTFQEEKAIAYRNPTVTPHKCKTAEKTI